LAGCTITSISQCSINTSWKNNSLRKISGKFRGYSYQDKRLQQWRLQIDQGDQVLLNKASTRVDQLDHLIVHDHRVMVQRVWNETIDDDWGSEIVEDLPNWISSTRSCSITVSRTSDRHSNSRHFKSSLEVKKIENNIRNIKLENNKKLFQGHSVMIPMPT
jgi:hypothetical protein